MVKKRRELVTRSGQDNERVQDLKTEPGVQLRRLDLGVRLEGDLTSV